VSTESPGASGSFPPVPFPLRHAGPVLSIIFPFSAKSFFHFGSPGSAVPRKTPAKTGRAVFAGTGEHEAERAFLFAENFEGTEQCGFLTASAKPPFAENFERSGVHRP